MAQKSLQINKEQRVALVIIALAAVALGVAFLHPFVKETSYATNSNVSVGYSGSDWVITAPTSTAADVGGLEFDIEGNPAGVNMAKKDTVTGGGTNVPDYQIYVSVDTEGGKIPATSGDAAIAATSGTVTDATGDVSGAAALSNNSWGFALPSFSTGINYDDLVSSSSSSSWASSKWSKLPYVATASVEDESTIENTATKIYDSTISTADSVDVYYAVNANNDLASGEYQTTVTYTLIGEMPAPTELADGLKMQEVTTDTCANTDTYANTGKTYELVDSRDNSTYQVRKLADGNCWMVQNLRLTGSRTLTSSNSNVSSNFTLTASDDSTWCTSSSSSCDDKSMVYYNNDTTYGAYYNWYAATAGTGTYSTSSGTVSSSICPKSGSGNASSVSWHLPSGNTSGEWYEVFRLGGITYLTWNGANTPFDTTLGPNSQFSLVLSGYRYGGSVSGSGSSGYGVYWSSTANGSNSAYYTYVGYNGHLYAGTANGYESFGYSVRCVLTAAGS